jgi:hypothetical protein
MALTVGAFGCGGAGVTGVSVGSDAGPKGDALSMHAGDAASTHADGGADSRAPQGTSDTGGGPTVYVRINAVQTPEGNGGVAQETPVDQEVAILGITLLKELSDPSPLVVVQRATPVLTPYNAGSSTLIGSVPASALVAGTYTIVRVPVAYVSFTVAGTLHYDGQTLPGDFSDLIALTSGTTIDGAVRDRAWWSSSFSVAGTTYGTTTGEDSAIAQPGPSSGIGLDLSAPTAAYVFPLTLTIPPAITTDMEIVFTANTYQDFHWEDETDPGYTTGVFDVSAGSYEPVTQLGANSATVTIGPVTSP